VVAYGGTIGVILFPLVGAVLAHRRARWDEKVEALIALRLHLNERNAQLRVELFKANPKGPER
jgi:hypothetical protein